MGMTVRMTETREKYGGPEPPYLYRVVGGGGQVLLYFPAIVCDNRSAESCVVNLFVLCS